MPSLWTARNKTEPPLLDDNSIEGVFMFANLYIHLLSNYIIINSI